MSEETNGAVPLKVSPEQEKVLLAFSILDKLIANYSMPVIEGVKFANALGNLARAVDEALQYKSFGMLAKDRSDALKEAEDEKAETIN
jgi:hypothetical protein